ncbi:GAF domain-containing sensor histidine kinase [Gemmatimonas phototrophica]|uniref:GAF domain-containing sensor histidine kinase n=1 Tax=Gemmatimonas phototrophica TaxID=1379270 RepID=UPI00047DE53B|nr:GAF domain-containing sensor histidine kinase [Gemmatimonas phototrophica]
MSSVVSALLALLQVDVPVQAPPVVATELAATLLQGAITTGVAVLCANLYARYRRPWFGWFAVAWGVYVARLLCILSFLLSGQRVWLYWHQVTTGWTALALLWAALVFLRQPRARPAYLGLALFPLLWSYIAIYQLDHFLWAALPAVLFLSGATAWTGWVFWRHHRITGSPGARLLAISFALWGLHHLDYPWLRAQGAWNPWGYYLDICFELLVAAGLVLLILDDLGRGVRALSALSGDLQRRTSETQPFDVLLSRPLALPGVRGTAMYLFEPVRDGHEWPDDESPVDALDRVLEAARHSVSGGAGAVPTELRGRILRGAGVCEPWVGEPLQPAVRDALTRMRVTRRPQVVSASGEQPFVAALPVGAGAQLVGALIMAGDIRNPFTALDDDFLLALGQQVGAALDQWSLDRQLANRTRALEQLSARMLRQHEEERRRLSRELHDETAQVFSAVKMQLEALRGSLAEGTAPRLDRLLGLVDTGIASIRQVTSDLRPTLLDDLGLRPALHSLVTDFTERSGVRATFTAPPSLPVLSGDADLAIFRGLQESLSNVVRHSSATQVDVTVIVAPSQVTLTVSDNGRGFPTQRGGRLKDTDHRMGITGMRERLLAAGGRLQIANRDPGAEVQISVPLSEGAPMVAGLTPSGTA